MLRVLSKGVECKARGWTTNLENQMNVIAPKIANQQVHTAFVRRKNWTNLR